MKMTRGVLLVACSAALLAAEGWAFVPTSRCSLLLRPRHARCSRTASHGPRTVPRLRMGLDEDLWEAAECNEIARVEDLVQRGANVNSANAADIGKTALHLAAFQGHAMCVAKLISLGADPNAQTTTGTTALHYCAAYGHFAAINYLIQLGADRGIMNDAEQTPLDLAKFKGKFGDRSDFKEVVKLLETGTIEGPDGKIVEGKYMKYD